MKKRIIVIDHEPLTIRRNKIFYLEELIANGFEVEFWDCSSFINKGMNLPDLLEKDYLHKFESLDKVRGALKQTDIFKTLFIVEVLDWYENRKLFRLLSEYHCFIIKQEMFATSSSLLHRESIYKRLMRMSPKVIFRVGMNRLRMAYYRVYKRYFNIGYDLIVSSGNQRRVDVAINHPDWELAQEIKGLSSGIKEPYAVFIDEFFPLHPDLLFFFHQKGGDAYHYYQVLNAFFDKIEKEYKLKIVIAAHPKSNYTNEVFNSRRIIKYHTAELIKDARMVFMHGSSALSFVMIFNKPLALLVTDEYKNTRMLYENVMQISQMVKLPVYNIEADHQITVRPVTREIRESYIYRYLTSPGIEEKKNSDILADAYSSALERLYVG